MGWDDKVREECYFCSRDSDPYYTRYICTLKEYIGLPNEQDKECPCEVRKWEPDYECKYYISETEIKEAINEYLDYRLEEIFCKDP